MQAAAEVEEFVQEMQRCYRLPHGQKPDMQQWRSTHHAHRILALQAFALDTANPADAALAIQMVQVCMSCSYASCNMMKRKLQSQTLCFRISVSLL